jgi:hypothetical protein
MRDTARILKEFQVTAALPGFANVTCLIRRILPE